MFCPKCGASQNKDAKFCPECGAEITNEVVTNTTTDSGSAGWGILGFFFPLIGLILFLVWKEKAPKSSKSAGIGALIGFISSIVFYIIYFVLIISYAGLDVSTYSELF